MSFEQIKSALMGARMTGTWVTADSVERLAGATGAYVLVLDMPEPAPLKIKRLKVDRLGPGTYLYVGSARGPGGLPARLSRHFRAEKRVHWHIDRLTTLSTQMGALAVPDGYECHLAERLLHGGKFKVAASGFGSTDCQACESHLLMRV